MNRRNWIKTFGKCIAGALVAGAGVKTIPAQPELVTIHLHGKFANAELFGKRAARSVIRGRVRAGNSFK